MLVRACCLLFSFAPSPPVGVATASATALRSHVAVLAEARKLEVEGTHQWKQTKHLLKYIKNQEQDIARTER